MGSYRLELARGAWAICLLVAWSGCDEGPSEGPIFGMFDSGGPTLDAAIDDAAPPAPGDIQAPNTPAPSDPADAADDPAGRDVGAPDGSAPPPNTPDPPDVTAPPDASRPQDAPGPPDTLGPPTRGDAGPPPTDTLGPPTHDDAGPPPEDAPAPPEDAGPPPTDAPAPPEDAGPAPGHDTGPPPEPTCAPPAGCAGLGGPWPTATTYPIVMVHGMAGFENIGPLQYFYGVPEHLRAHGHGVWTAVMDPFNGTPTRASQLAGFVDEVLACTCAEKVNLVAHSQGGLDARYLVSALGYADRVASVTTIATPHRGIALADVALGLVDGPQAVAVDALASVLGALYADPAEHADVAASLLSVSTMGVTQMEEQWPTPEGVVWRSWAGISGLLTPTSPACDGAETKPPAHGDIVPPALYGAWLLNGGNLVPSDGLVPVASARFGRFRGCIAADHMDEIGQLAGATDFDYLAFYVGVADALASEGF